MSASVASKQVFKCRDLPTSVVTLYPSKASIVRDIENIEVKQGINQIEITGINPLLDEESLKVDGSGSATITDMTVSREPNPEKFYEIYPDEDDVEDDESDSESDYSSSEDDESDEVQKLRADGDELQTKVFAAKEARSSIQQRLNTLTSFCQKTTPEHTSVDQLQVLIKSYGEQREALFKEDENWSKEIKSLEKQQAKQRRDLAEATKAARLEQRRIHRQEAKERKKAQQKKKEARIERQRIHDERARFWPLYTYKVVVMLEVAVETPLTMSRRTSVSSITMSPEKPVDSTSKEQPGNEAERSVSLKVSYMTSGASWKPRYDINFSTTQSNGAITYRAELRNETSETWNEAKLWLSTSQTSFVGVGDECPRLRPWHVQLRKATGASNNNLLSEQEHGQRPLQTKNEVLFGGAQVHRGGLFGIPEDEEYRQMSKKQRAVQRPKDPAVPAPPAASFGALPAQAQGGALYDYMRNNNDLNIHRHQQSAQALPVAQVAHPRHRGGPGVFGNAAPQAPMGNVASNVATNTGNQFFASQADRAFEQEAMLDLGADEAAIDFEDTSFEDHGFTTQFELPGKRSLAPSSDARRHKIATLPFSNLQLLTIAVPKLRAAAFLRARFRNPSSSITLIRGTAGITLDGSFLGTVALPRASPHEQLTLPLGVDPAVHVSYARPTVLNSKQGLLTRTSAQRSTRSIVITNTKKTPVTLTVLDQIPCATDEKLALEILSPAGLRAVGDSVRAGANARPPVQGQQPQKWGSARAELKKEGQLAWSVTLEKGAACVLALEFETRAPGDEVVVNA